MIIELDTVIALLRIAHAAVEKVRRIVNWSISEDQIGVRFSITFVKLAASETVCHECTGLIVIRRSVQHNFQREWPEFYMYDLHFKIDPRILSKNRISVFNL